MTHFLSASVNTEPTSSPSGAVAAVKATLRVLYCPRPNAADRALEPLLVLPERLMLVPDADKLAQLEAGGRVPALTHLANAAAASIASGSVLAGQTSESDEFGDVGFWLGAGSHGPGNEQETLRALGLAGRTSQQVSPSILTVVLVLPSTAVHVHR